MSKLIDISYHNGNILFEKVKTQENPDLLNDIKNIETLGFRCF